MLLGQTGLTQVVEITLGLCRILERKLADILHRPARIRLEILGHLGASLLESTEPHIDGCYEEVSPGGRVANGANVNATAKNGATPLKVAAAKGRKDIVELLKRRGAKE